MAEAEQAIKQKQFAEFLESTPPYSREAIAALIQVQRTGPGTSYQLSQPQIRIHCENEACQGLRFFESTTYKHFLTDEKWDNCFLVYVCRNCSRTLKTFSIR